MGIPFLVYLPPILYREAKTISQQEGTSVSFLLREGLKMALEARKQRVGQPVHIGEVVKAVVAELKGQSAQEERGKA